MKKNLRKIPNVILDRIRAFDQDDVVAATVKLVGPEKIGNYDHLGIRIESGNLKLPQPRTPDPDMGRFSHANLFGREKIRKDLPKYTKEFGFWAPSWNSGSYHYVSHDREVYQRDFYPPKEVELSVSIVERRGDSYLLKFTIEQVINRRTDNFEQELLYNLNLLQENVGAADVFESAATLQQYAASVRVDWQLLPPGSVDEVVEAMLRGKRAVDENSQAVMKQRIAVMAKLNPEEYVTGTDGFLRYFGAKFGEDFVAFENVQYGNALYVLYEDWETMSRKSRIEILAGDPDSFERILHNEGWQDRLKALVYGYRKRQRG